MRLRSLSYTMIARRLVKATEVFDDTRDSWEAWRGGREVEKEQGETREPWNRADRPGVVDAYCIWTSAYLGVSTFL